MDKHKSDIESQRFDDLTDKFMRKEMTPEEESEYRKMLEDNPDLKKKAAFTARTVEAMAENGSARDKEVVSQLEGADKATVRKIAAEACGKSEARVSGKKLRKMTFRRWMISIAATAAVVLCAVGGYRYHTNSRMVELGKEYLAAIPATEFSRGDDSSVEQMLQDLRTNVAKGENLEMSVDALVRIWDMSSETTYNPYTNYHPEIGWILANAYLCNHNEEDAAILLDQLAEEYPASTALGAKVRELRSKL